MFLWLLHVETKFFTNVKPSSKMQTVVSYAVFTYRFKKHLNQASHFTAITTNIRSINSQPVKVKVNVGIGEG